MRRRTGTLCPIPFTKSIALQQDTMGFGDLLPMFAERWNACVNNYMVYLTGDIPIGRYSSSNLANIGIGHGALDGGLGYTYIDQKAGHEFSAGAGLTGNFEDPSTDYTNGIDFHLDRAASQFLTKQLQVGVAGYVYDQLTQTGAAPLSCARSSPVSSVSARRLGLYFPSRACRVT